MAHIQQMGTELSCQSKSAAPKLDTVAGTMARQPKAPAVQVCPPKFNAPNPYWGQKTIFKHCPLTSTSLLYHVHVPIHNDNKQNNFKHKNEQCTWLQRHFQDVLQEALPHALWRLLPLCVELTDSRLENGIN